MNGHVHEQTQGVQEVRPCARENETQSQTYGNSQTGDHMTSNNIRKLRGDSHIQAAQEPQCFCVNKEGVLYYFFIIYFNCKWALTVAVVLQ
jgi:hypothetical protein